MIAQRPHEAIRKIRRDSLDTTHREICGMIRKRFEENRIDRDFIQLATAVATILGCLVREFDEGGDDGQ